MPAMRDTAAAYMALPASKKMMASIASCTTTTTIGGGSSSKALASARTLVVNSAAATNGVEPKKSISSKKLSSSNSTRPSSAPPRPPPSPPPVHHPRSSTSMARVDAGDDDVADERLDGDVLAPPIGLRGLLQQKESSSSAASLSSVGSIYGDIQRALVNFPKALQVLLLLLLLLLPSPPTLCSQLAQADVSEESSASFRLVDKPFQIKYPRGGGCVCVRFDATSASHAPPLQPVCHSSSST